MDFTALFVDVDDFWKAFKPLYDQHLLCQPGRRRREGRLGLSEIMTILIAFQTSRYRDFKHFYLHLLAAHRHDFPGLVHYSRFVWLMKHATLPLLAYLHLRGLGRASGISFVDSTALQVCHPKRIRRHQVFRGWARIGKTTMGWFYGFKLHLVINDRGELLSFTLTPGNVDDRQPVTKLAKTLWGKLFGDKGYISVGLFEQLQRGGVKLITNIRANMKNHLMPMIDKILLRKRSLIETVNDQLKNVCQIQHTRHRSPLHFVVHLLAGLAAYSRQPKKPSLKFHSRDLANGQPLLILA